MFFVAWGAFGDVKPMPWGEKQIPRSEKQIPRGKKQIPRGKKQIPRSKNKFPGKNLGPESQYTHSFDTLSSHTPMTPRGRWIYYISYLIKYNLLGAR